MPASNQAPTVDLNGAALGTNLIIPYGVPSGALLLAPQALVSDADSPDFDGGQVTIGAVSFTLPGDRMGLLSVGDGPGQIAVHGKDVTYGGVVIGTIVIDDFQAFSVNLNAQATPAAVQALVRSAIYTPAAGHAWGGDAFSIYVEDGDRSDLGMFNGTSATVSMEPAPPPPPPPPPPVRADMFTPSSQSFPEDGTLVFSAASGNAFRIVDDDLGGTLQLSLRVDGGTVQLGSTAGISVTGNGSDSLAIEGSAAAINAALDGMVYTPRANLNGLQFMSLSLIDPGVGRDDDQLSISITAVNDAPQLSLPGAQSVTTGTSLAFSSAYGTAPVASDVDATTLSLTLSVAHGTISASRIAGLTFLQGDGSSDMVIRAIGSLAAINTALDSLVYRPDAGYSGADAIQILIDDRGSTGSGGRLTASGSIALSVAPGSTITGDGGDNHLTGTASGDSFLLQQGGHDHVAGGDGSDGFFFGGTFEALDSVDGGDGVDTLALQGDVATSLAGVSNVEVLLTLSGSDTRFGETGAARYHYALAATDANVAAGHALTVSATALLAGESLSFDGSAESDGAFRIYAGQGVDILKGGAGSDGFFFGADGNLTGADRIDGGAGLDTLALRGDYQGARAVVFDDASFARIEVVALLSSHSNEYGGSIVAGGFDYDLKLADGNVAAGQRLDVNGGSLGRDEDLHFDGSAEHDGSFRIIAGAGNDVLTGGDGADIFFAGLGQDRITGGGGGDVFAYRLVAESTSTSFDTIVGFDATVDRFDLPNIPYAVLQELDVGKLSLASFDADLSAALMPYFFGNQAILFTPNSGDLAGRSFFVVDANFSAGYQAGQDFVFEIVAPVHAPESFLPDPIFV